MKLTIALLSILSLTLLMMSGCSTNKENVEISVIEPESYNEIEDEASASSSISSASEYDYNTSQDENILSADEDSDSSINSSISSEQVSEASEQSIEQSQVLEIDNSISQHENDSSVITAPDSSNDSNASSEQGNESNNEDDPVDKVTISTAIGSLTKEESQQDITDDEIIQQLLDYIDALVLDTHEPDGLAGGKWINIYVTTNGETILYMCRSNDTVMKNYGDHYTGDSIVLRSENIPNISIAYLLGYYDIRW